jgi:hypothetical protein
VRKMSANETSPESHVASKRRVLPWLPIERLPKPVLCVPLVAHWIWLAMRYRSLTLPSAINPAIETGGLAGESKSAGLAQIGETFASFVAPWRLVGPGEDPVTVRRSAGFAYPLIAKPDIGWCGFGVRRIEDDGALSAYAAAFPRAASFIVQHLVTAPKEAGLFYVRQPGSSRGRLLGITLRHAPHVTGDGVRTVSALIYADPRTRRSSTDYIASRGMAALDRIPARNECVVLTTVASLRVGARYEDASAQVTAALEGAVDSLARAMPDFHLGRFDVRFACMAALRRGEFSVIEVNGAGSEAIHFWDPALPIRAAFAGVFAKQRLLFRLGAEMRDRGAHPVGALALSRAWLRQQRLIACYPSSN